METALVTGISGFVGEKLANRLVANGYNVVGISRASESNSSLTIFRGDLKDNSFVTEVIKRINPSLIVHLASEKLRSDKILDVRTSIENDLKSTLNLIESSINTPHLRKFISLGSCDEYGHAEASSDERSRENPSSPYALSKSMVTHLLEYYHRMHQLPVVILRPSLIYGPGQKVDMFLPALINSLLNNQSFKMSKGEQTRDYIYIEDVINAIMLIEQREDLNGEILNLSSNESVPLKDIVNMVVSAIDINKSSLVEFGAISYRSNEAMNYAVDSQKVRSLLGWSPKISLASGISQTIKSYS